MSPERKRPITVPSLESHWEGGTCRYQDDNITLHSFATGKSATMKLDMNLGTKLVTGDVLICASSFTVLLVPSKAIVTLGGPDVLDGREWLGQLGTRFTWANSYSLDLSEPEEDGGNARQAALCGEKGTYLCILGKEKAWKIDLADPFRDWEVQKRKR